MFFQGPSSLVCGKGHLIGALLDYAEKASQEKRASLLRTFVIFGYENFIIIPLSFLCLSLKKHFFVLFARLIEVEIDIDMKR
jgi:hypothetical protein